MTPTQPPPLDGSRNAPGFHELDKALNGGLMPGLYVIGTGNRVIIQSPGASITGAEKNIKQRILESLTRLDNIPADILLAVMRTVRDVR
jgi:hypothetical protein